MKFNDKNRDASINLGVDGFLMLSLVNKKSGILELPDVLSIRVSKYSRASIL